MEVLVQGRPFFVCNSCALDTRAPGSLASPLRTDYTVTNRPQLYQFDTGSHARYVRLGAATGLCATCCRYDSEVSED